MSKIEAKILNPEVIRGFVQGLEDFEKDKAIQEGLRKGGQVFVRGGRSRLRNSIRNDGTGNLMKSLKVKIKRKKLGALVGFRRPIGNHSHLIDRGTKKRHTKLGANRGKVKPTLFWLSTAEEDRASAFKEVVTGIERAVNRIKQRI